MKIQYKAAPKAMEAFKLTADNWTEFINWTDTLGFQIFDVEFTRSAYVFFSYNHPEERSTGHPTYLDFGSWVVFDPNRGAEFELEEMDEDDFFDRYDITGN